ncbi:MAG: ECF-type sigma factor [Planctomycetota bacterium]
MTRRDVTLLLDEVRAGSYQATEQLMEAVYDELRSMAASKMSRERSDHTLQPTALVNEAFLRLVDDRRSLDDRSQFFAAAALAMQRVLVDHARARSADKRGGGAENVTLDEVHGGVDEDGGFGVLELDEILGELEQESEELALLVRYRYFLGLRLEEIAPLLDVSVTTVRRRWTFVRAWLLERLA